MGKPGPTPGVEQILAELKAALGQQAEPAVQRAEGVCRPASSVPHTYRVGFVPGRDIFREGMDPLLFLRDLSQLGERQETQLDLSQLPPLSEFDPESCYLGWSVRLVTAEPPEEIAELFAFVADNSQVSIEVQLGKQAGRPARGGKPEAAHPKLAQSLPVLLRVPLAKAADLIHLALDLVRAQASLLQTSGDCAAGINAPPGQKRTTLSAHS